MNAPALPWPRAKRAKTSSPPVATQAKAPTARPVAVGLCRCSTDTQEHSIADQEAAIRAWGTREGVQILQVFKDEGVSGLHLDRPGLQALLAFLESHSQKGRVVAWSRDRLTRPEEPVKGLLIEHRFSELGWKLHYLTGPQPTGDPLVDALMSLFEHHANGEYPRKLARDSIRGILARLHAGQASGAKIPYGYAKEIHDGRGRTIRAIPRGQKHRILKGEHTRLVLGDPAEVESARWIFEEYARGEVSPYEIACMLEERSAPRCTEKRWSSSQVRELLLRPVYVGDLVWNRETSATRVRWLDGQLSTRTALHRSRTGKLTGYAANDPKDHVVWQDRHPAIVSRDLFERVQQVFRRRAGPRDATWSVARCFALSGLMFCGECGGRVMAASTQTSRTRGYSYYLCPGVEHRGRTTRRSVRLRPLEDALIRQLIEQFESALRSASSRRALEQSIARRIARGADTGVDADDEARRIVACLRRLPEALRTDDRRFRRKTLLGLVERVDVRWIRQVRGKRRFQFGSAVVTLRVGQAPRTLRLLAADLGAPA